MKFYTRQEVIDAGVPIASVDRWSRIFRNTAFVVKKPGKRLLYSADFLAFALARKGHQGPANLPTVERIVALYAKRGTPVQVIAAELGDHPALVEAQLRMFQLPVVWEDKNAQAA